MNKNKYSNKYKKNLFKDRNLNNSKKDTVKLFSMKIKNTN